MLTFLLCTLLEKLLKTGQSLVDMTGPSSEGEVDLGGLKLLADLLVGDGHYKQNSGLILGRGKWCSGGKIKGQRRKKGSQRANANSTNRPHAFACMHGDMCPTMNVNE